MPVQEIIGRIAGSKLECRNIGDVKMLHVVAFDLPFDVEIRKDYRLFRKNLTDAGYQALQKSIYYSFFEPRARIVATQQRILAFSPKKGEVVLSLTDDVFSRIIRLTDNNLAEMPKPPKTMENYMMTYCIFLKKRYFSPNF